MLADNEVAELSTAWKALREQTEPNGLRTIALGLEDTGIRAGVTFPSGAEILMAGFNLSQEPKPSDLPEGSGFRVELSNARKHGRSCWVSLTRQAGASSELFLVMAADVFRHIGAHAPRRDDLRLLILLSRITTWQEFMKRPKDAVLSNEEEVGLFGELSVLLQLLAAGHDAGSVVRMWTGPGRAAQDFQTQTQGLEVKATVSVNGFPARINSLAQLDHAAGRDVYLAAIRLMLQADGMTLPELIDAVRSEFESRAAVASEFDSKIMLAGYSPVVREAYERKFSVGGVRVWRVEDAFPRLCRSLTPMEILSAEYVLDLDAVQQKSLTLSAAVSQHGLLKQ